LNERGYRDSENALGIKSLFEMPTDGSGAWAPYIMNAVKAKELFKKDVDYSVIMNGDQKVGVGIIDAFTGRVLDGRRWSDGLHQSIEAKEGIDVSQQSKVIAKVTYQVRFYIYILPQSILLFPRHITYTCVYRCRVIGFIPAVFAFIRNDWYSNI